MAVTPDVKWDGHGYTLDRIHYIIQLEPWGTPGMVDVRVVGLGALWMSTNEIGLRIL